MLINKKIKTYPYECILQEGIILEFKENESFHSFHNFFNVRGERGAEFWVSSSIYRGAFS